MTGRTVKPRERADSIARSAARMAGPHTAVSLWAVTITVRSVVIWPPPRHARELEGAAAAPRPGRRTWHACVPPAGAPGAPARVAGLSAGRRARRGSLGRTPPGLP